jgi:hypothetical protein
VKVGLTNYSAAYCTGLLLARRVSRTSNLIIINGEETKVLKELILNYVGHIMIAAPQEIGTGRYLRGPEGGDGRLLLR